MFPDKSDMFVQTLPLSLSRSPREKTHSLDEAKREEAKYRTKFDYDNMVKGSVRMNVACACDLTRSIDQDMASRRFQNLQPSSMPT
eukprot:scaffold4007_cov49-Cyclotella_meneghiniana.AAC.12